MAPQDDGAKARTDALTSSGVGSTTFENTFTPTILAVTLSNPTGGPSPIISSYEVIPTNIFPLAQPPGVTSTEYKTLRTFTNAAAASPSSNPDSDTSGTPVSDSNISSTDTAGALNTSPVTKKGISGGAAAGIGIGGVIIGALIALLFAFIFMKRSRKHRSRGGHRHSSSFDNEKIIGTGTLTTSSFDETLLDRADDSQLRKSVQDLTELIDQHVENNYHLQSFEGSQGSLERRLVECGYSTEPSVSEMAALLLNPRTRFVAIREVIAKILTGNLDVRARPELSLLPPQIVGFVKSIPPVERQSGADEVFDKAFTKWRHLSAFLLEPSRSSREAPKADERQLEAAIGRNVALINGLLKPFINPGFESQRSQENNLSAIIFEGAQLGLLLFSQPSVWTFGWKTLVRDDGGKRAFVVFPSLAENIDRHGRQRLREISAHVAIEL